MQRESKAEAGVVIFERGGEFVQEVEDLGGVFAYYQVR